MTYPTAAVARLQAWDTANFGSLTTGAVIQEFDTLAQDYSEVITFTLDQLAVIDADATTIDGLKTQAEADQQDASDSADAAAGFETAASNSADAAAVSAATAASRAAALTAPVLAFLYANGDPAWQAL